MATSNPARLGKRLQLVVALAAALGPAAALADNLLKDVVVTATRGEAESGNVMATVTSLDREEIDRRLPRDEADLFKDEPGVVMPRDNRRHGTTQVNIRGIEGNRVLMLVDGIRLPDYRNGGGPTNHTVNTPLPTETAFLKRAEVLRGPASSLYGSDALGGVVGFVTLEPADLLQEGRTTGFRYSPSWHGADHQLSHAAFAAVRGESWEALVGVTHSDGEEAGNKGSGPDTWSSSREKPNPQDVDGRGLLAKLNFRPAVGHVVGLALEGREQDTFTEVKRLSTSLPRVTWMQADDHGERLRGSLSWEHTASGGWYDKLSAKAYRQNSVTNNRTRQERTNTSSSCSAVSSNVYNCYVELDYDVEQDSTGLNLTAVKGLEWGGGEHLLTYGLDLARVETVEERDGRVWNLTNSTYTNSLAGEVFPLRDFPPGHQDSLGLFVQDEITFGRLTVAPGLRYDVVRLKAEPDALTFQHAGHPVVDKDESAVSPKLALRWRFTPETAVWGQLVRGFRAPNYEEVNGSFRNTAQFYGIVPNPDLKPETSTGFEIGLKHASGAFSGEISLFDNRYKDFIDSVKLVCPGDPNCLAGYTTYQSVNVSKARIHGAEARAAWAFAPGWRLSGTLAYAHGQNETDDQPINSIEPLRGSLALLRDAGTWGVEARVNAAGKVKRVDDTQLSSGTWYKPDAWQTLDLSGWWKPSKNMRLNVALNNVLDEKYWLWGDIRLAGLTETTAGPDYYSQPGRNLSLSLQADF